ncbi:endonuclease/exonuclease/phosphatase family protein [Microbispora sp. H10836]|uniref:endonuclease/exonuclease/phosphatase family protein n=1 Tax=Microbispora sp. H10836 TaxID=2729106 RepID=UPI001473A462|nr:endonuclease/exonuclease/phosphatase family protein [Microbispora sp. H10836]
MTKLDVGGEIVSPPRRGLRVSPRLAWVAAAPFALWAAARLAGVDRIGGAAVALMTGTPHVAAASLAAVLVALAARRPAVIAVAAASSVLLAAVVLPRAAETAPTATGPSLRILTVNLFYGSGDAATVVDLVRGLEPDVLTTQELTPEAVGALDAAGLGRLLPYRHLEDGPGPSGSGIYARHPLTKAPGFAPEGGHNMPRARLALPSGPPVEIVDVHTLAPLSNGDVAQWTAELAALPAASPGVVRVLAGDFNASLDHSALRAVLGRGYADAADATGDGLTTTWPANRRYPPLITIDHVMYDRRASAVRTGVHTVPGSDHRALFAELRLPGRL